MIELKEQHTSDYIVQQILKTLDKYNISAKNIYSFNSDNGANIVKAGKVFENFQCTTNDSEQQEDDDEYDDDSVDVNNYNELLANTYRY